MNAVDTNVLIYVRDPRDPRQATKGASVNNNLKRWRTPLAGGMRVYAASRKLAQYGFDQAQAWRETERLRVLWKFVLPSEAVLTRAKQLTGLHGLSFWDGMIIAACAEGGITKFYTEDFDASLSSTVGVEIINPF